MTDARLAELERLAVVRRRELDVLEARLEEAARTRAEIVATWSATSVRPRPLLPLAAVIAGVTAANAAMLCAFVMILSDAREPLWNIGFVLTAPLAVIGVALSRGPGAGGRTRHRLRALAVAFIVLSMFEIIYLATLH